MSNRRILRLTGPDAKDFLQGLITNDIGRLASGLVYAALLTPQGKYLSDFFVVPGETILIDAPGFQGDMLMQRLSMYKLRADIAIGEAGVFMHRGLGDTPVDGWPDPRHGALGWRAYRKVPQDDDITDWTALRIEHLIPEAGVELHTDTYIVEAGFERLNGVDFRKGCYIGQEVTARMKHKTALRKGLAAVQVEGDATSGTPITQDGKAIGMLHSVAGDRAIAYLRFDKAGKDMRAGKARVMLLEMNRLTDLDV